jgi:hypothetical protein
MVGGFIMTNQYNKRLIESVDELKEFILWCKKEGVKSFKNTDVEFHLSDLAIISSAQIVEGKDSDLLERVRIEKELEKSEFEELLFHSSKPG